MSPKHKPDIVIPPSPGTIPTLDLLAVLTHRRVLRALQEQVRVTGTLLTTAEEHVQRLHEAGAVPEDPRFTVRVVREPGPVSPRWKQEHVIHMAEVHGISPVATEETVRARSASSSTTALVIEEHLR